MVFLSRHFPGTFPALSPGNAGSSFSLIHYAKTVVPGTFPALSRHFPGTFARGRTKIEFPAGQKLIYCIFGFLDFLIFGILGRCGFLAFLFLEFLAFLVFAIFGISGPRGHKGRPGQSAHERTFPHVVESQRPLRNSDYIRYLPWMLDFSSHSFLQGQGKHREDQRT